MVGIKRWVVLSFVFSLFIFSSIRWAEAMINSIDEVREKVQSLRTKGVKPREICVVLDFHGVIVEQEIHQPPLTPKGRIIETLQYLKDENIPYLIATAWDDFNAVVRDGSAQLDLKSFFDVDPNYTALLEDFILGSNEMHLRGYRNGRMVALKYKCSEDIYFRQKAFACELVYPSLDLKYIIFVDDSKGNLEIFAEDSNELTHTGRENFEELILLHFQNSQ